MKILLYAYLIINIIAFILMYVDKRRAIKRKWRISEATLMYVAIFGGSLGSLFGMHIFHHKTKHLKFKLGIPVIILLQLALVIYLFKNNLSSFFLL